MKAYVKGTSIELEIRNFWNAYNDSNVPCVMCDCFVKAFGSLETIPAGRIEIR